MPPPARVASDSTNSPVDFCSEQPAIAGPDWGHRNIYLLFIISDKHPPQLWHFEQ